MQIDIVTIIGIIAALLTTGSFLPQALLTIKTRNTDSISLAMYLSLLAGVLLWLLYGLFKGDFVLVVANSVTFLFAAPVAIIKLKNGRRSGNR